MSQNISSVSPGNYVLTTSTDPTDWRRRNNNILKEIAPTAAQHIETGINEVAALIDPIFETVKKVARKPVTNDPVIFDTLTMEEMVLPVVAVEPPPANLLVTVADVKFYYSILRMPEFMGDGGRSKFDLIVKNNSYRRNKFYKTEMPAAYSFWERRISPEIRSKIEIPWDEYETMRNENDYMLLLTKAELAVTGGGVRAVGQSIIKLTQLNLRSVGGDFVRFCQLYNEAKSKLWIASQALPAGTDFRRVMFDVMFTFALSHSDHPLIQTKMQNNLSANNFVDVDILQNEIITMISNYEGIHNLAANNQGVLYNANIAKKATKAISAVIQCFNCWRTGHKVSECPYPIATCTKCNMKGHCALAHDKATASLQRTNARKGPHFSTKKPAHDSPLALITRQHSKTAKKPFSRIMPRPNSSNYEAHNALQLSDQSEEDENTIDDQLYNSLMLQNDDNSVPPDEDEMHQAVSAFNTSVNTVDYAPNDDINDNQIVSFNYVPDDAYENEESSLSYFASMLDKSIKSWLCVKFLILS